MIFKKAIALLHFGDQKRRDFQNLTSIHLEETYDLFHFSKIQCLFFLYQYHLNTFFTLVKIWKMKTER